MLCTHEPTSCITLFANQVAQFSTYEKNKCSFQSLNDYELLYINKLKNFTKVSFKFIQLT